MTDPIAAAIAATEPEPEQEAVVMAKMTLTLASSGRSVQLAVPADINAREALDLVGFVSTKLGATIAELRGDQPVPRAPLLVPAHKIVRA